VPDGVLTLIAADPARGQLDAVVAAFLAMLEKSVGNPGVPEWLAPGIACDIAFSGLSIDRAYLEARKILAAFPAVAADLVVQPADGRRKRLLVADMESTIIENEMLDELAELLGLRAAVAEITRQAMNGEIDFVAALEARVALLEDMPAERLDEAAARIRITPGAATLVATMRWHGAYAALVSGGFTVFTARVRGALGFDCDIANVLTLVEGRLVGTVRPPIVTRETKLATLRRLAAERGVPLSATLAVGDGANDIPMLEAAGLGIAFHAKPAVTHQIRARIDHGDLTALLYAQGYRAEDIDWR
jgi:phosphoserine phosphatase